MAASLFRGWWVVGAALSWSGCYVGLSDGGDHQPDAAEGGEDGGDGDANDGDGDDAPGRDGAPTAACDGEALHASEAPLRRLSSLEYANTVQDLFPELGASSTLVGESPTEFHTALEQQPVTPLHIERIAESAQAVAELASTDLGWSPCDGETDPASCLEQIVDHLGPKAYRRPLTDAERAAMVEFAMQSQAEYGFEIAVRIVIEGLLESPYFLYRPELGVAGDDSVAGAVQLTGYEMATRLSYLLWQTMPDDELFAAAGDGDLATREGVEAQVRRMLDDERAHTAVQAFHREWLALARLDEIELDPAAFPEATPELTTALRESTEAFFEHAFWEDGTYEGLMRSEVVFVDERTGPLLGVEIPAGESMVAVELPDQKRAGLLTQPGVLTSTSHDGGHSPIFRGVLLLDRVLCRPPPAPPAGALDGDDTPPAGEVNTTRDAIELAHTREECAGCHQSIDGAGFLFENYDALGRFRTEENGYPVDPSGELVGTDVDGPLEDAQDLADALAASREARHCLVRQWYRFAAGRTETPAEACALEELTQHLEDSDDQLEELVVGLATSIAYRYRPLGEEGN